MPFGIHCLRRKGQAVSSLPQVVATSLLIKEDLQVFSVGQLICLAHPDRE